MSYIVKKCRTLCPTSSRIHLFDYVVGWDEGCLTMSKGEIAKLTIRGDKGYGPQGFPAWGYPF